MMRARILLRRALGWILGAAVVGMGSAAHAADDATSALDRNDGAIRWHLPDQFEAAVARAKKEKRILLIKGVSFGIDEAGAKCATKGKW